MGNFRVGDEVLIVPPPKDSEYREKGSFWNPKMDLYEGVIGTVIKVYPNYLPYQVRFEYPMSYNGREVSDVWYFMDEWLIHYEVNKSFNELDDFISEFSRG